MRRLFWVGVGVAVTVVVARKVKTWTNQQPVLKAALDGQDKVAGVVGVAKGFVDEFTSAMERREAELRASLLATPAS